MLNTSMDETAMDFPMSSTKPGQYSVKEIPKAAQTTPKPADNLIKRSQTNIEKLYQITTSLPVTSSLLAAITSQGVPVGGSFWYINYLAILVIFLTAVAVAISYLSVTASHSYCETIFLTVYTPVSQLFSVSINFRDVHQDDAVKSEITAKQVTPTWFKQLLFISIALAATNGLTMSSVLYATCMVAIYHSIARQLKSSTQTSTFGSHVFRAALVSSVAADVIVNPFLGVLNLMYFIVTDSSIIDAAKQAVDNKNIEIMEGLEQYYTAGLVQMSEIIITLIAVVAFPCFTILYIPICYFCIYKPLSQFKDNVRKINFESLCLSNFEKATVEDISSYDDVCAVCLCAMTHARITPCKHIFHGKCLKDCLKKKAQCPMCNSQVL